jgi:hypothetical protein
MSALAQELEQEFAHESAHELPAAHEVAHEQEGEHEAFFNHLAAMGERTGRSQALRKIALAAARAALRTQPPPAPGIEGEFEGELENEFEATSAGSPAQIDAMLEHLGHTAAEAANEQEAAEHFLPLVPLAAKMVMPLASRALGKVAARVAPQVIRRVTPTLTRAVANATRTVFRSPTARPLLHAMPRIARTTVAQLARRVSQGRPITPKVAIRTLARNTYRTLSNPRMLAHTYRRSLRADSRHHNRIRRYVGQTPYRYVQGYRYGPGSAPAPTTYGTTTAQPVRRWRRGYASPVYTGYRPGYVSRPGYPGYVAPARAATLQRTTHVPVPPGAVLTGISYTYSLPRR